ncbi:hypothetical protein JMJ77_0012369, partial [Colletotrichum scovillei]
GVQIGRAFWTRCLLLTRQSKEAFSDLIRT